MASAKTSKHGNTMNTTNMFDKFRVQKTGMNNYGFSCFRCGSDAKVVTHCHPYYYYDFEEEYVIVDVKCKDCNNYFHTNQKELDQLLNKV